MRLNRIAVLVSGGGTNLQALIDAVESGYIPGTICQVIASKPGIYALERAKKHNIPASCICRKDYSSKEAFDDALLAALTDCQADVIVLAGYLSILGKNVIQRFVNRIINVHPSLIPAFCGKGFYGEKVHQAAIDYGVKVSGVTVHFVDEGTDTGPIIMQKSVEVLPGDDAHTLAQRVLVEEHKLLPMAVKFLLEGKLQVNGRLVAIEKGE